tara:strand:+ start:1599 stop:1937 length:339 start_codon:yes stop_codon:yes gene_type:complete
MNTCLSLALAISMHFNLIGDYNSVHPHARCTLDNNIFGAYYNSESKTSLYVGRVLENVDRKWNMEYGLTTGYSGNEIVPMWRFVNDGFFVAPAYEYDTDRVGVTFGYEFKIK